VRSRDEALDRREVRVAGLDVRDHEPKRALAEDRRGGGAVVSGMWSTAILSAARSAARPRAAAAAGGAADQPRSGEKNEVLEAEDVRRARTPT
jgi:hypothetical protein